MLISEKSIYFLLILYILYTIIMWTEWNVFISRVTKITYRLVRKTYIVKV